MIGQIILRIFGRIIDIAQSCISGPGIKSKVPILDAKHESVVRSSTWDKIISDLSIHKSSHDLLKLRLHHLL